MVVYVCINIKFWGTGIVYHLSVLGGGSVELKIISLLKFTNDLVIG